MNIKGGIRKLVNALGYDIRPLATGAALRQTIGESYLHLRQLGFRPKTVVDVGVATGTMELYRAFPDSEFLLVEPLKEFEPDILSILKQYKGSYVLAAASAEPGEITFNVHRNHLDGSSLYKESMGSEADGYEVTVAKIRVDDILKDRQLSGPYLIKVDVQGAELDVLDGAQEALSKAQVVVLEVSLFQFMKGAPQFYDVVEYMKGRGFVAYDIILGWNRPLDGALGQVDIVFVEENGAFRKSHVYSTVEQMKILFGN